MNILVYTENANEWKEIAKWLSLDNSMSLYNWKAIINGFDGNIITVFWGVGHYYLLETPKDMNINYSFKSLPILPNNIWYKKDDSFYNKSNLLANALNLLKNTNFDLLVFAWNPWKEWLSILDRLYINSECKLPIEYIWKWDSSKKEIRRLWKNRLKWSDKLLGWEIIDWLTQSAHHIGIIDWKIWMNFSQLYTLYYKLLNDDYLSFEIWRITIPILNMINIRENNINNFITENYYKLKVEFIEWFNWYLCEDINNIKNYKFCDYKQIESIQAWLILSKEWKITEILSKEIKSNPPFWLNWSNIEVSRKLNITPKQVINIISELYSKDWVMSYSKTSSKYISEIEYETIKETILFLKNSIWLIPKEYNDILNYITNNNFKTTIPIINNKKIIEWHGSFHIKFTKGDLAKDNIIKFMNWNDNKSFIFRKIINNNLWFFLPLSITKQTIIKIKIWNYNFYTKELMLVSKWYKFFEKEIYNSDLEYLNKIEVNDIINIDKLFVENLKTKPLARINTDNIIAYINNPAIIYEDIIDESKKLYDITDKCYWIWQQGNRQNIIDKLVSKKYVFIKNWEYYISNKWKIILENVDSKVKDISLAIELEKELNNIAFTNNNKHIIDLVSKTNLYITHIIKNIISDKVIEKYKEKFENKKVLIELKTSEWFNLYMKEDKKSKWKFRVTSDDNIWKDWYPIFNSNYNPITKKLINNNHICNTINKCPKCSSSLIVYKNPNDKEYYIECSKRKSEYCNFVSPYNIQNDTIIKSHIVYLKHLNCEYCNWRIYIDKSIDDWNHYWICEYNNENEDCLFKRQYDRTNWVFILPYYMRTKKNTWLQYQWKELYENKNTFFSIDWTITIWKNVWWINIDITILKELITTWKTKNIIKGFESIEGNIFPAKLKLKWDKISYYF